MRWLVVMFQGGPIEMLRFKNSLGYKEEKFVGSSYQQADGIAICTNVTIDVSICFKNFSISSSDTAYLLAASSLSRNGGA
jgi:hypothetical protein